MFLETYDQTILVTFAVALPYLLSAPPYLGIYSAADGSISINLDCNVPTSLHFLPNCTGNVHSVVGVGTGVGVGLGLGFLSPVAATISTHIPFVSSYFLPGGHTGVTTGAGVTLLFLRIPSLILLYSFFCLMISFSKLSCNLLYSLALNSPEAVTILPPTKPLRSIICISCAFL